MTKHHSIQNLDRTLGLVTLCVLIYAMAASWYSWVDEKANYLSMLTTVTSLEVKTLNNYFSHMETDLTGLGEDMTQQGDRIDLAQAFTLVKRFRELHPELFNVTLISPTGEVLLTAKNPPGTFTATLAKEPSFIAFMDEMRQGKTVSLGQPLVSVISKAAIVPVRHALKDHRGNLSYIVSANLPIEYLRSFWMDAPITSTAAIGLMRDNGYLLSRFPVPANLTLAQVYGRPRTGALINHLQKEGFPEQGYVQGPSSLDGPDFMNAFRRLPNHHVTLFVALPMSAVRAAWLDRVSTTYIALLLLSFAGFAAYRYAKRSELDWNNEQSRLEDAVRQMAFHDALTGLPNRRLLLDRLTQVMGSSKRTGRYAAIIFLDLDNFKPLNDAHGHEVGDLLLIEAASRLTNCVREIDTVARFGGDEFVVMLSDLNADREESRLQAHAGYSGRP